MFKLVSNVSFAVYKSLLALVAIRHFVRKGFGHFDIVSENLIVSDFERADTRFFPFSRFEVCEPFFCGVFDIAHLVESFVVALFDVSAVFVAVYALSVQRTLKSRAYGFKRVQSLVDAFYELARCARKKLFDLRNRFQSVTYRKQIFRRCVAVCKSAVQSFEIAHGIKRFAESFAQGFGAHQIFHCIKAFVD